jgi:gas vesicle protein
MRDQDDVPYIVIDRGGGSQTGSFILGALVGAGLALLLAPKSGEETQAELKERARQLRDTAEDKVRVAQQQLEERLDTARGSVTERMDTVKEAVSAGRQAAIDARGDLERKLETSKAAYRAGIDAAKEAVTAGDGADDGDGGEED